MVVVTQGIEDVVRYGTRRRNYRCRQCPPDTIWRSRRSSVWPVTVDDVSGVILLISFRYQVMYLVGPSDQSLSRSIWWYYHDKHSLIPPDLKDVTMSDSVLLFLFYIVTIKEWGFDLMMSFNSIYPLTNLSSKDVRCFQKIVGRGWSRNILNDPNKNYRRFQ